jgi:hypothetical protein
LRPFFVAAVYGRRFFLFGIAKPAVTDRRYKLSHHVLDDIPRDIR